MDPFLGEIRIMPYGSNYTTRGWAPCSGQILSIAQNSALFALLGVTYGGNGSSTFALPNLNGRLVIGPSSANPQGVILGTEQVNLLNSEMPGHIHTISGPVPVSTEGGGASTPQGAYFAATSTEAYSTTPGTGQMATLASGITGPAGGSLPHENRMPYLALGYFIALEGIFPERP
jgi:microcystin-dependent protein